MRRRRLIITAALIAVIVLIGVLVVAAPLIQDMFTPPIAGLPTVNAGSSLRDRFTQTAAAKTQAVSPTKVSS